MFSLSNQIRDYAWGSRTHISGLLSGETSPVPQAEMWIGAHPASPSQVLLPSGQKRALDQLIHEDPKVYIGEEAAKRYGTLPFLTKLLAAAHPLSLQVHPSIDQARQGFEREEKMGLPLDAPERNYKDRNHKPEMVIALTAFEALSGFRDPLQTIDLLHSLRRLTPDQSRASNLLGRIADLLPDQLEQAFLLALTSEDAPLAVTELAQALSERDTPGLGENEQGSLTSFERECKTFQRLEREYPADPGALVALLLNRVHLEPGQALFLPAGNVHAYLEGFGLEVMATSDNVLRGGLTPKHVDVPELSKTVEFSPLPVPLCIPEVTESAGLRRSLFTPPFEEFQVEKLDFLGQNTTAEAPVQVCADVELQGAGVVVVTSGTVSSQGLRLGPGQSGFVPSSQGTLNIQADAEASVFVITGSRTIA